MEFPHMKDLKKQKQNVMRKAGSNVKELYREKTQDEKEYRKQNLQYQQQALQIMRERNDNAKWSHDSM
ncbi:hypothetical protein GQX74_004186 [Glossina fuscipes]|nr:hypothetical protein GQX74_004186 [Glossina fuscipes]